MLQSTGSSLWLKKLRDERKFKFDRVALIFRNSLNEYIIQAMIAIANGVS